MVNSQLILAGHGGTSRRGRASIERLVDSVRRAADDFEVHDGFIDLDDPGSAEVLAAAGCAGVVVPLTVCLDSSVDLEPQVRVAQSLGPDWALAEIGVRRLIAAGARSDDSILLAADVVSSPEAVRGIGEAARLLSAVWGGPVHLGVLGGPDTSLSDALDITRAYGRRVVIWSYVLAAGGAHDALLAAGADVVTDPLLNADPPDPRLVALVMDRARSRMRMASAAGF